MSFGQSKLLRVLFLGNSYTASNNLPQWVADFASANGDSLVFQSITPGGQYLLMHSTDQQVVSAFQQGGWDYIVMQEQSQIPVIPFYRESLMLPGALALHNLRNQHTSSSRMLFFLTWGREQGGQQCNGGHCSYAFQDFFEYQDTLTFAYQKAADTLGCGIAPAGEMWRQAYLQHSGSLPALSLFSADGSHPDIQGTYLTALTLYTVMFERSLTGINYNPPGISAAMDTFFRHIVDSNVWPRSTEWRLTPPSSGPVITAHPQSQSICIGDSLVLEVKTSFPGNYTYQWFKDSMILNQFTQSILTVVVSDTLQSGFYYCMVSDSSGSASSDSANITVNLLPLVNIVGGTGSLLQVSDTLFLDAGAGFAAYLWSLGDTTQTIRYSGWDLIPHFTTDSIPNDVIPGKIWVIVFDSNGCQGTDTVDITVLLSGMQEKYDADLKIFPNPATDAFSIYSGLPMIKAEILTMAGQKVGTFYPVEAGSRQMHIVATITEKGVYLLRIYTSGGSAARLLIIQ